MDSLVQMLLPVLATLGGRYAYEGIQILAQFVDTKIPTAIHGVALVIVNWLLLQLGMLIGMEIPTALEGFTPEIATAIAMALGQLGWHKLSKDKEKA